MNPNNTANKKFGEADFLNLICYNLAQLSYVKKRFSSLKNETNYTQFFENLVERIQDTAYLQTKEIHQLTKQKHQETDSIKLQEIETKLQEYSKLPYSPIWVVRQKNMARCVAKSLFLLGDFEIILADQKKEARPIDSVAKTNLFGSNPKIKETYATHYQEKHALGPLIHSLSSTDKPNQDRLEALFSLAKPSSPVRHQIWINDHLMVQSNLLTTQSLNDFLMQDPKRIGDLFYLVAYAEEIEKKANGHLTQEFINSEIKQMRMEHLKREGEKYIEQYALITIELFGKLISLKKNKSHKTQDEDLYNNLNDIAGIKAPFEDKDVKKMKKYLQIRDLLSHPTEFNLRPMGDSNHPDMLSQFETDMVSYLSNLLNMDAKDITNQIATFKEEEAFNVHALLTLMDTGKALRSICLQQENLVDKKGDAMVKLGFIDTNERKTLVDALNLRNTLCHEKINFSLAMQAEELAAQTLPIINKIATCIDKKYGVSLKDYYQPTPLKTTLSLNDFQKEFPFMNTKFETDPDKTLFEEAVQKINPTNDQAANKELLQKLHTFALVTYHFINQNDGNMPCPYVDGEFIPFYKEIDNLGKNPESADLPNLKQLIAKGILKGFEKGYPLPTLKQENQKN